MKRPLSYKLNILLFLLPALFLFLGVLIAPIIMSGYYSFFDWGGPGKIAEYIGLGNYKELFTSSSIKFMPALGNSLLLALKLGKKIRGERAFLSIYFMPVLISTVVIGQLWIKIYNPD